MSDPDVTMTDTADRIQTRNFSISGFKRNIFLTE